ncbi:hypothetical protein Vadar_024222 [Vaccinium darrowii]|uniref:Uncharacterized protein n=1 Tax=Vaccinium darrowii TaxID=229202 RepID=A0ACB7Z7E1_9ERIC|nr:hypothetical protein Vadar_024222 [Vaccinium darrowii]
MSTLRKAIVFLEEEEGHLSVEMEYLLEQETSSNKQMEFGSYGQLERSSNDSGSFEEIKMPFLEMLQSGSSFSPFSELGGFQALLCLQQQQQFKELPESCLTHDAAALEIQISPVKSDTVVDPHLHRTHSPTVVACNHHHDRSKPVELEEQTAALKGQKKRKRVKRTRPALKNKEEIESQRMTHIAVERNRRRQMNDHLTALRSLMPSSYIQRGDQASIIGGAIDYVKELEQLHQSLQAQKRMKKSELFDQPGGGRGGDTTSTSTSSSSSSSATSTTVFLATSSPTTSQCGNVKSEFGELGRSMTEGTNIRRSYEFTAEKKSGAVEVHVTVIQNHVNLKVVCPRKAGQLLKAIVGLEELGLTVLHLNIMALENSAHYSFNLKIEEGCDIGSADGIAAVVHHMFSFINGTA